MAPIIIGLEKTVEDPGVKDESGRLRLYAHDDYIKKFLSHGFLVE